MKKRLNTIGLAAFFSFLLCSLITTGPLQAANFTADMVETYKGETKTNIIYVLGHQYRMDVQEKDRAIRVLVDRETGKTRLIVPREKVYLEIDNDDMQSVMNNPFAAREYMAKRYETRAAGTETVNGLACEKQIISAQGKDLVAAWISTKYDFVIKQENLLDGRKVKLENLQEGGVDPSMFDMPAGYKLVKSLPIAPPDWDEDIVSAPILTPPFEKTLEEGQIIRIKPVRDHAIDVKVETLSGIKGSFSSNAFKDGRPISRITGYAGGGRKIHKESPDVADEIVVRAKSGQISVSAELIEAPEGLVLKTYALNANSGRQFNIDHRKAARLIVSDDPSDGKSSRGTMTVYTTIEKPIAGGTAYDKKELESFKLLLANGESKEWHFERDQGVGSVDITLLEGNVNARLEQPEKPGTIPPLWAAAKGEASEAAAVQEDVASPSQPPETTHAAAKEKGLDSPRMVLVLDGSGSMWGQIEGKAKIEIAKAVMNELIDAIPPDFQTGLMAYGHRRKGDCQDIEMLLPVGSHDAAAMNAKVRAISPKGKTPLSGAVRQAARALRHTEERATVILVSDGIETCDADPCSVAAELAMSGVDFTVHVIGFDISQGDQVRLRCLADRTGGLFLPADSASDLRDALYKTVEEVKAQPPPVVEDPGTASLKGPDSVPAGSDFKVEWQGPDSRGDYIAIAQKGSPESRYRDYVYTKSGNPVAFTAPGEVGDYEMRYIHAHTHQVIGRADIAIIPVQAKIQAPTEADVAVTFEVRWQGPDYQGDYIAIARPDQRPGGYVNYTYTRQGNPLQVRSPSDPGLYEIRYIMGKDNQLLAKTTIEIKGVGASVDAPAVADVANEFEVSWEGPGNQEDYIAIARLDQSPGGYVNYTYTRHGSPLQVRAPSDPGTYEVRYILGRGKKLLAKTTIEIKAVSASVQAPASADVANEFEVSWEGPGNKEDYITVARLDQSPGGYVNYTYTRHGSPLQVRAPSDPGTYEVRYILGRGKKLLAKTPIEIKAVSAKINSPSTGTVNSKIAVTWQGPGYKEDYICISRPDQRPGAYMNYTYTRKGNPLEIKTPTEPGAYEVRYILGRGKKVLDKATITIK